MLLALLLVTQVATDAACVPIRLDVGQRIIDERRYFRALPKTAREFWCIYGMTYEGAFHNVDAANDASCGIYDRAPRIARKLGIGHKLMIDIALWSDGEVAEHGWDAFYWLIENDPELMAEALKRYPQSELRGCEGPLTPEMSVAEVVRRCRDQR